MFANDTDKTQAKAKMDGSEDDDFYAPTEDIPAPNEQAEVNGPAIETEVQPDAMDEDLEEGEEEEEDGSGSDGSDSVR